MLNGFKLRISGAASFAGLASASGTIEVTLRNNSFELYFDVQMALGPVTVKATGFAGIYAPNASGQNGGMVLRLAVSLDLNVLEIVKIKGSGELRLNTSNIDRDAGGVMVGAQVLPDPGHGLADAARDLQDGRDVHDGGRRRHRSTSAPATRPPS